MTNVACLLLYHSLRVARISKLIKYLPNELFHALSSGSRFGFVVGWITVEDRTIFIQQRKCKESQPNLIFTY